MPKSLTKNELINLVASIAGLQVLLSEFKTLQADYPVKFSLLMKLAPLGWAPSYTQPLNKALAFFLYILDEQESLKALAAQQASPSEIFSWIESVFDTGDISESEKLEAGQLLFPLLYPLIKSVESIGLYGLSLHDFVLRAENGDDAALFKAVSVDPAILGIPFATMRVMKARADRDKNFLQSLAKALHKPSAKYRADLGLLRYILNVLHEREQLAGMTDEERYQLLVVDLGLYPADGEDPMAGLKAFINRWNKSRT